MSDRDPIVSDWCGQPRYACPLAGCPVDGLDETRVREHIAEAHPLPPPAVIPAPVIVSLPNGLAPAEPAKKRGS